MNIPVLSIDVSKGKSVATSHKLLRIIFGMWNSEQAFKYG